MAAFKCALLVVMIGLLAEWGGCMGAGRAIQQFEERNEFSETAYDGQLRDLLRKRRKSKPSKKVNKRNRARSAAANSNDSGVLVNQQDAVNIKGNGNSFAGGRTAGIRNTNVNIGDGNECSLVCSKCSIALLDCLNACNAFGPDIVEENIAECCDDGNCPIGQTCNTDPNPFVCE